MILSRPVQLGGSRSGKALRSYRIVAGRPRNLAPAAPANTVSNKSRRTAATKSRFRRVAEGSGGIAPCTNQNPFPRIVWQPHMPRIISELDP